MPWRIDYDLTGETHGNWTVIKRDLSEKHKGKEVHWVCRCKCGRIKSVPNHIIRHNVSSSCVHCNRSMVTHNGSHDRLHDVWADMKQRCDNENNASYHLYGGRGIKYCEDWASYESFKSWAYAYGYDEDAKTKACTIDRINVNGDYTPENCRWVDAKAQARNRQNTRRMTVLGVTKLLVEWSELTGIGISTLSERLKRGWSDDDALLLSTGGFERRSEKPIDNRVYNIVISEKKKGENNG